MSSSSVRSVRCALAVGALCVLAGCVDLAPTPREDLGAFVEERGGAPPPEALETGPVTGVVDEARAHALALARNARLRARLAELGVGRAQLVAAARLPNPVLDLAALESDGDGSGARIMTGLALSLTDVLVRDIRIRRARDSLGALVEEVGGEVLELLAGVSAAHLELVAARQVEVLRQREMQLAVTALALAERFDAAGNFSERELAEVRARTTRVRARFLDARAARLDARRHLADVLGVDAADAWTVPDAVRGLPDQDPDLALLDARAGASRLELIALRTRLRAALARLPELDRQRWLEGMDLGFEYEREPDDERLFGGGLSWAPPLLDDRLPRIEAQRSRVEGAQARLAARELEIGNALAMTHARLVVERERVAFLEGELAPAQADVVRVLQQEVNFMISGPFELLAARAEEYGVMEARVRAHADYWQHWIELERLSGARMPAPGTAIFDPLGPVAEAMAGHGTHGHGGGAGHGSGHTEARGGDHAAEHAQDHAAEHPGDDAAEHPGGHAGEHPGDDAAEHPGGHAGEHPGDDAAEHPGGHAGEHRGGHAAEHPGGHADEHPGESADDSDHERAAGSAAAGHAGGAESAPHDHHDDAPRGASR